MPRKKSPETSEEAELLKDLLIVQLAQQGIPAHSIRSIVGCAMNRVTRITRHLKASQPKKER